MAGCKMSSDPSFKSTDDIPDKLWRTLVADRGPNGSNPPSWYQRACLFCLNKGINTHDINTEALIKDLDSPAVMVDFLIRVYGVIFNRRFFKSKEKISGNRLFGFGPPGTKLNGIICILHGCSVPVSLRKRKAMDLQETKRRRGNDGKVISGEPTETAASSNSDQKGEKKRKKSRREKTTVKEIDMSLAPVAPSSEPSRKKRRKQKQERVNQREASEEFSPIPSKKEKRKMQKPISSSATENWSPLPSQHERKENKRPDLDDIVEAKNEKAKKRKREDDKMTLGTAEQVSENDYYFELMGGCYVYGMMDGEAKAAQDEGRLIVEEEKFNIR